MGPLPSFISTYLRADKIVGALLAAVPGGLVLSFDIGGSLFDTIARRAAASSSQQFLGQPSLLRHRSQLRGRRTIPGPLDIIADPVLFGRIDGFIRIADESKTFEAYGSRFEEVAIRSLDSWTAGRPTLRHIHFGDPELALDQMAGATELFARDRPTATLYTSGMDRPALLSLLERSGYAALDLNADEVHNDEPDVSADFGWIAYPLERQPEVQSLVSELAYGDVAQFSEWEDIRERNAIKRQRSSGAVFGLRTNAPRMNHRIAAADIIAEDDCYPLESDSANSWRWLGPRARTRLSLPCAFPGMYRVEVAVLSNHLSNGLAGCRVLVEGAEVEVTTRGTDTGTIQFIGQLDAHGYVGYMTVDIVSCGEVASVSSDPRVLRLSIQSIAISSWR